MISFYFKGGQPEQGCEFAHKSFREFLFAECVVETLKEYGRRLTEREAERLPPRDYWRDFSRDEDRPRYDFSRELAYLLAPQWVAPNVWDHLQHLIEWEISRAATASNDAPDDKQLSGLPTQALRFERWKYVRDGLADLWEWWCDCAHLRPQVRTDRWKKSVIEPPFVEELIRWAAPLTAEENEALPLASATSIDAHLGDSLCQICAMVHFYIAVNEGLKDIEPGALEYVTSDKERKCQRHAKREQMELVLFAPGGENVKQEHFNPTFRHYFARINSAFGSPLREFPSRAILNGIHVAYTIFLLSNLEAVRLDYADLFGARLVGSNLFRANLSRANLNNANLSYADLVEARLDSANLDGADLNSANLSRAHLNSAYLFGARLDYARLDYTNLYSAALYHADLRKAIGLTREQIESAWIDEATLLPEDLEKVKSEILERQRLRIEQMNEMESLSPGAKVKEPEEQRE